MATGSEVTHAGHQAIYKTHGGNRLVVDSSGEIDVISGGKIDFESGGYFSLPVQSLLVANVATSITNFGVTTIAASTTGPTYTLAAPVAGAIKIIAVTSNTSSGTASVNTNSTGVSVSSSGDNQLQFNSITDRVTLVAQSTSAWLIVSNVGSVATALKST